MITIDWLLLALMLAGTASLSALAGLMLGCVLSARKASSDDQCSLCGHCNHSRRDFCMTAGKGKGFEKRRHQ